MRGVGCGALCVICFGVRLTLLVVVVACRIGRSFCILEAWWCVVCGLLSGYGYLKRQCTRVRWWVWVCVLVSHYGKSTTPPHAHVPFCLLPPRFADKKHTVALACRRTARLHGSCPGILRAHRERIVPTAHFKLHSTTIFRTGRNTGHYGGNIKLP